MKLKLTISLLFTTLMAVLYVNYMQVSKKSYINLISEKSSETVEIAYDAILYTYNLAAQKDYYSTVDNKEIVNVLKNFKYANEENKNVYRGELYRLLYKKYDELKKINIRQFHFHTHDGNSLLRFHVPYKSGDSLMDLRTSIKVANTEFKRVTGFEGGRIYPGYRYVFPIIVDNDHLGSVEISISFEAIEKKLKNILTFYAHKIIYEKSVINDKVFKSNRKFFTQSIFDKDYYVENSGISNITKKTKSDPFVKKLTRLAKNSDGFTEKINKKIDFFVPVIENNKGYIISFLSVTNINNKHSGYIVSYKRFNEIVEVEKKYNIFIFIGLLTVVLMYIFIITIYIQIRKVKEESLKLNKFIDIQDTIVILTNGKEFKYGNKKFFDFFGYLNIEEFLKRHSCICELFIKSDNFFSLANVIEDEDTWIDSLLNMPGRKRIVSMKDKSSMSYAFTVSINKYDDENYVVNFSDISDTIDEKLKLQEEAIVDQLTKTYNRSYFDKNINDVVNQNRSIDKRTGIIVFDIDYFKEINDTYGHLVGDNILKTLAKIVKKSTRSTDKIIRWSGNEFMIIVSTRCEDELYNYAEHLRKTIEKYEFENIVETLTCSFGIELFSDNLDMYKSITRATDKVYVAKENGRNKVIQ